MYNSVAKRPIHNVQYTSYYKRLQTYDTCDNEVLQDMKVVLCEAGFYYSGRGDSTICYYCNGGLKEWEKGDNPWKEHAKWFPRCTFLRLHTGYEYIEFWHKRREEENDEVEPADIVAPNLRQPQEEVSEEMKCIVCLSLPKTILFLPCAHCCTCITCALSVDVCVYCRAPIIRFLKVAMSVLKVQGICYQPIHLKSPQDLEVLMQDLKKLLTNEYDVAVDVTASKPTEVQHCKHRPNRPSGRSGGGVDSRLFNNVVETSPTSTTINMPVEERDVKRLNIPYGN